MTDETPGPGHNNPPTRLESHQSEIDRAAAPLIEKIRDYQVGMEKIPPTIDDKSGPMVVSFILQGNDLAKEAEALRVSLKKPLDDMGKQVQATLAKGTGTVVKRFAGRLADITLQYGMYQQKKERAEREAREAAAKKAREDELRLRLEAEAKEREAAEAARNAYDEAERAAAAEKIEEAAATTKAADDAAKAAPKLERKISRPVHTEGAIGGTAFTKKGPIKWKITEPEKLPVGLLWSYIDDDTKLRAIKAAHADGFAPIPGTKQYRETSTQIR